MRVIEINDERISEEDGEFTFSEYVAIAANTYTDNRSWRLGQTFFNVLVDVRPDLSEIVRATPRDPFHNNNRLGEFLTFVAENW